MTREKNTNTENRVESLVTQFRKGNVGRRDFLRKIVAAGVSSAAAYTMLESSASAQNGMHDFLFRGGNVTGPSTRPSTMAVGEEGTPRPNPRPIPRPKPKPTTQALGEEGNRITTHALGEEGQPYPRPVTTRAYGEECQPRPIVTTQAFGEEDRPRATTARVGEEDRPQATTLAVGEEGAPRRGIHIQPAPNPSLWQGFKRW